MPDLPAKFSDWQQPDDEVQVDEIVRMYSAGMAGAYKDEKAEARLSDWIKASGGGYQDGADVAHAFGFADAGKGQLSMPFLHVVDRYPKAWPSAAQQRGSCVAHNTMHAMLMTMCCEVVRGQPDEVTGKREGFPLVSAEAERAGVLSTEAIYWWRDHGGDGWSCEHAAEVACKESGMWLRQNYPDLGIDLTDYSAKTEGKWGARNPPAEVKAVGQPHLIRVATRVREVEAYRDFTAMGIGLSTCGSEGFSNQRNEHGVAKRKGSWAHAMMGNLAFDDRPEIHAIYGEPLIASPQSWGKWNSGPRDIFKSASYVPADKKADWIAKGIVNPATGNIMLPEGAFWARWSDWKRRSVIALGGAAGWPTEKLPNWGTSNYLG